MKLNRTALNFIVFPAIAMMLGWGLRGYIGGGPFGAMIPGAMVAVCLSILLKLPLKLAAVLSVFSVVAIGLGGEMTYGQTLGFLRNPETMWWGILGISVKGAVWGFLGGIVVAMGINFDRLPGRRIIIAFIILLAGMLAGFKLINQPMIIYFSDRSNPRPESWGALLTGATVLLIYLNFILDHVSLKIVWRFAIFGMAGGMLGFGLGGFWLVLGSHVAENVIFNEWWKSMEFTFGLLLGAFLGIAAWLSRKEIAYLNLFPDRKPEPDKSGILIEFIVMLAIGIIIFWACAACLDPVVEAIPRSPHFTKVRMEDMAIIFSNYAFYGFLMVLGIIFFPSSAWQIAITLTFCHTVIDLSNDYFPDTDGMSLANMRLMMIVSLTLVVAALTAWFQRHKNVLNKMLLLLTWSTVIVAFLRYFHEHGVFTITGLSVIEIFFGKYFVHLVFLCSAVIISVISMVKTRDY